MEQSRKKNKPLLKKMNRSKCTYLIVVNKGMQMRESFTFYQILFEFGKYSGKRN